MGPIRKLASFVPVAVGAYTLVVRPRLLRWGATDDEVRRPYPGADLIPGGTRSATNAITIDAPPAKVWPWLVQMGYGRAGWYSWHRLDNWGRASADRIHPEWQAIAVGAPLRAPSAYASARSRTRTSTPGWASSQAASVPASRPCNRSMGRCVSRSTSTVP